MTELRSYTQWEIRAICHIHRRYRSISYGHKTESDLMLRNIKYGPEPHKVTDYLIARKAQNKNLFATSVLICEEHRTPVLEDIELEDLAEQGRLVGCKCCSLEIGSSNNELLGSLLLDRGPEQVTLKEVNETMASRFQPKKPILTERYGLSSRSQRLGHALQEYSAGGQRAAATCEFEKIIHHRGAIVTMPLAIYWHTKDCGMPVLIDIVLCFLFWFPAMIYAFWFCFVRH
ncbi:hypothetical protein TELCIR_11175 [Teladorsagia circumcincta]|uniref:Uncharacterized protein n=1 Tax=Teladorsagia circumcincta TaxID=45464 RepID=A0A2G9UA52_TELCI|nr:hypothetical protein TELCIR_11175 [Teladorsagia circumcincta]